MEISACVLDKMKAFTDKEKFNRCHGLQHIAMDGLKMNFRDEIFDITVDKGTYDALACDEKDKTMIMNLTKEMLRVTKKGGAVVIITNGTPEKRLKDFESFSGGHDVKIDYKKVELAKLSQMINIMRSTMGNKPLSHCMKDVSVLKKVMEEMVRIDKVKKEDALMADKKTKLFGMLLRSQRLKREKEQEEKEKEEAIGVQSESTEPDNSEEMPPLVEDTDAQPGPVDGEENQSPNKPKYNPKRQDFCMMYVLYKN